jgi:energy-converting hydrogenase B subunit D
MTLFLIAILLFIAVAGTAVVLTRDVFCQPIGISFFGLMLAVMFMAFRAPDVALSQVVIGAVGLPLMVLLALARLRRDSELRKGQNRDQG